MSGRPPGSTRTDTLVPYSTLVRISGAARLHREADGGPWEAGDEGPSGAGAVQQLAGDVAACRLVGGGGESGEGHAGEEGRHARQRLVLRAERRAPARDAEIGRAHV